MKHLIALTLGALLLATATAQAQLKIGYASADSVVRALPETKAAMKDVESRAKQWQNRLATIEQELQAKQQQLQQMAESGDTPQLVLQEKSQDLQKRYQEYQQEAQKAEQEVAQYQQQAMQPILERVRAAIQEVAKQQGYDYVISQDTQAKFPLLYAKADHDITTAVIAYLKEGGGAATTGDTAAGDGN